jgi:uncharacterized protein (DUF1330 family)
LKYYGIAEIDITDPAWTAEYVEKVTPLVEQRGGRYLARTTAIEQLEGERQASQLVVIIEWPSKAAAEEFYASDDYRPFRESRMKGSRSELLLVAGEDVTSAAPS